MSDEIPDWVAQLDQIRSGVLDFARIIRAYHLGLVEQGFSAEDALVLTLGFQAQLMQGTHP